MRESRLLDMEKYIRENRSVSLDKLCEVFNVSKNTIRRDVARLCEITDIEKIYGGVSIQFNRIPPSFIERADVNLHAKQKIGKYAASLVQDDDVIFIDSGTTTCQMVNYLGEKHNVTIITHSLDVIVRAFAYPNLKVIILPGTLDRRTYSFTNQTEEMFRDFNVNKAFMACTGFTVQNGASQAVSIEYTVKKGATQKSHQSFLMIESSKIGNVCFLTYCPANRFNAIITDKEPGDQFRDDFSAIGGKIIVP